MKPTTDEMIKEHNTWKAIYGDNNSKSFDRLQGRLDVLEALDEIDIIAIKEEIAKIKEALK